LWSATDFYQCVSPFLHRQRRTGGQGQCSCPRKPCPAVVSILSRSQLKAYHMYIGNDKTGKTCPVHRFDISRMVRFRSSQYYVQGQNLDTL
jgi:hypothetical protein